MTKEEMIKALNEIKECPIGLKAWYVVALDMAIKALEQKPCRRKGHWLRIATVNTKDFCNRCSECGYEQFYAERYNYCPNCGARMESEE